ncbi:MAG: hypothetical protein U0271_28440 [Polyangiaceae bacterium]
MGARDPSSRFGAPTSAGDGASEVGMWMLRGLLVCLGCVLIAGCTDEGEDDGGAGGLLPVTGGGGAGNGGSPMGGGGASAGGAGGAGGGGSACLDASVAAADFTLGASALCVVEVDTAAGLSLAGGVTPTWGRHGGPLTFETMASTVVFTRWTANAGALTPTEESFDYTMPGGAFAGGIAVEGSTPAGNGCSAGTALTFGWTGASFTTEGAAVHFTSPSTSSEQLATGIFGMTTIGDRFFYTGLSAIDGATNATPGLYFADAHASCEGADFAAGSLASSWGAAAGPVAADSDGNLFAVMTDFVAGTQEIRGFKASEIAPGGTPSAGATLATMPGFGDALAALAPTATAPGLLVLQPTDATTFVDEDVLALEYTADAGGDLSAMPASTLLTLTTPGTNVALLSDDEDRLWVGVTSADQTETRFYVLARKPD